jgi:hypothetical protein
VYWMNLWAYLFIYMRVGINILCVFVHMSICSSVYAKQHRLNHMQNDANTINSSTSTCADRLAEVSFPSSSVAASALAPSAFSSVLSESAKARANKSATSTIAAGPLSHPAFPRGAASQVHSVTMSTHAPPSPLQEPSSSSCNQKNVARLAASARADPASRPREFGREAVLSEKSEAGIAARAASATQGKGQLGSLAAARKAARIEEGKQRDFGTRVAEPHPAGSSFEGSINRNDRARSHLRGPAADLRVDAKQKLPRRTRAAVTINDSLAVGASRVTSRPASRAAGSHMCGSATQERRASEVHVERESVRQRQDRDFVYMRVLCVKCACRYLTLEKVLFAASVSTDPSLPGTGSISRMQYLYQCSYLSTQSSAISKSSHKFQRSIQINMQSIRVGRGGAGGTKINPQPRAYKLAATSILPPDNAPGKSGHRFAAVPAAGNNARLDHHLTLRNACFTATASVADNRAPGAPSLAAAPRRYANSLKRDTSESVVHTHVVCLPYKIANSVCIRSRLTFYFYYL